MNCASQFPNNWTTAKKLSIIDLLYKNFQHEQLNYRRFPVFPEVVDTLTSLHNAHNRHHSNINSAVNTVKTQNEKGNIQLCNPCLFRSNLPTWLADDLVLMRSSAARWSHVWMLPWQHSLPSQHQPIKYIKNNCKLSTGTFHQCNSK